MAETLQETVPQWANYLDLNNDVKPFMQFRFGTISNEVTAQLQLATDTFCSWMQDYLARPIMPIKFFRRFSGYTGGMGGAHILLPYYPVIGTPKVVEYWGASGPHELKEQTPAEQGGGEMFTLTPLTGRITRSFQGLVQRPFFPGLRNVEVTWRAGYEPVPQVLKSATLELIAHWWRNTQQVSRNAPQPVGAEYDMGLAPSAVYAGIAHLVAPLISPYAQQGIG